MHDAAPPAHRRPDRTPPALVGAYLVILVWAALNWCC
jgi:hypothetical protein